MFIPYKLLKKALKGHIPKRKGEALLYMVTHF